MGSSCRLGSEPTVEIVDFLVLSEHLSLQSRRYGQVHKYISEYGYFAGNLIRMPSIA